jgi:hypothetical protein
MWLKYFANRKGILLRFTVGVQFEKSEKNFHNISPDPEMKSLKISRALGL